MKKIKQNIVGFILGAIIFSVIGVYAGSLMNSNEITFVPKNSEWGVNNISDALDELHTNINKYSIYSSSTTIAPTNNTITLNTKNKLLKNDITINAIPSTYKNLENQTTITPTNILNGKTIYNSNGEIVTGTLSAECVVGNFTITSECATSTGCVIFEGFNPTKLIQKFTNNSNNSIINYYNSKENSTYAFQYRSNTSYGSFVFSNYYRIENNKLIYHNAGNDWKYPVISYIVCK